MTGPVKRTSKEILQRIVPNPTQRLVKWLRKSQWRVEQIERNMQRLSSALLLQQYPELAAERHAQSDINKFELGVYSQNGEDGILLYIFSQIGATNRSFVEFGIEDGRECNTANLSINFGWRGLLMDIDDTSVTSARNYYAAVLGERSGDVTIIQRMVTAENINPTLVDHHVERDVDLLCIDIDSNDYWVWRAITAIEPRVVVVEYNPAFGPERSLTIKYQTGMFNRFEYHPSGFYYGVSLTALTKLAQRKDYSLVGCDSTGINAFFVRNDVLKGSLKPLIPSEAYYRDMRYYSDVRQDGNLNPVEQFEYIKDLEYEEIS